MTTTLKAVARHAVQIAEDFGTWTTVPNIDVQTASEGCGTVVGTASMRYIAGTVAQPGGAAAAVAALASADLLGKYCRILIQEVGGSVSIGGLDYNPIWHGVFDHLETQDRGGGSAIQLIGATQVQSILGKLYANFGWDHRTSGGSFDVVDPGYLPKFNDLPRNDRSTATYDVNPTPDTAYVHERGIPTVQASTWQADLVLDYILKTFATGQEPPLYLPTGNLDWTFADPDSCLAYTTDTLDLNGMTILDCVNALIPIRRGLTWYLTISGTTATINVRSITPSSISSGTYTLPASTKTAAPDLSSDPFKDVVTLTEDESNVFDSITVIGAQPWVGITLEYKPSSPTTATALKNGWTSGQETAWNAGTLDTTTERVWNTFQIRPEWLGQTYNSSTKGIRNYQIPSVGDMDGTREHDNTLGTWQPETLTFERLLPIGEGFTNFADGPRQTPICGIYNGTSWYDMTGAESLDPVYKMAVNVDERGFISIGSGPKDQANIKLLLTSSSSKLIVTVGVRESAPLRVRWQLGFGARDLYRQLTVVCPQYEQWVLLEGAITKITSTPTANPSEVVIRDDLPAMYQAIALLRAYYAEPARKLSWTYRGSIDHSLTLIPGTLITTATLGIGVKDINSVIVSRRWAFTSDGYGTSYETGRFIPDISIIR